MIVDTRKKRRPHQPLIIRGLEVERVSSFRYLGVYISEDLTWTLNTTQLIKKAQHRLYFLRRLRKFGMSAKILCSFYSCTVESTLTSCITAWYGSTTAMDSKRLQRVITTSIYNHRVQRRAASILKDPTHPQHRLFTLLPPRRRFRSVKSRTSRLNNSFFPTKCNEKIKCADENIIIQLGKEDKKSIVATHFPCSCIDDGESLIISCRAEKVEGKIQHSKIVHPKEHYSVFYIDTVGGLHTKTKELFKNNDVKQFKNLCVYGEKGITVAEALKRDGRFIDDLGYFELSNNQDPKRLTVCTQKVEKLHQKQFKIRLPKDKKEHNGKSQESPSNNSQSKCERRSGSEIVYLAQQEGIRVKTAVKETSGSTESQEENFGKIQQSFSQVHRVRKLLELGKSVCKVVVKDVSMFDTFILTSAHLFKGYVEGKKLQQDVEVFAIFDYEEPEPVTKFYYFRAENTFTDFDADLDYAVLEAQNIKVPPGLLSEFGPLPANGEACIIGHPAGGEKMDPTCIIETDKRGQAIDEHLYQYKNLVIIKTISDWLKEHGIDEILIGGSKAGKVVTYHTFMYHGASGSPVFDGLGRVFGLHTAGYICDSVNSDESVIEYSRFFTLYFCKPKQEKTFCQTHFVRFGVHVFVAKINKETD
uniref:Alkylated DNA repair protein AlkB homologue 8 N-terminal domain-containing protein n=1 Tax=Oreochromis aureus TaxID=47969 RepID=A0AAZ1XKT9_OREAU